MLSSLNILLFFAIVSICSAAIREQFGGNLVIGNGGSNKNDEGGVQFAGPTGRAVDKRRILDLLSILNKRRDSDFVGGPQFVALPVVQTRSLEHSNCYFSPIQCYLEERKRRSAGPAPREPMMTEMAI